MHFRFRGNNIQVVRSQVDPATGKAKPTPLGSINRASLAVSDRLRENCTPAEIKEIETWVKRYQSVHHLKNQHAALTLPEQMAAAAEWFETAKTEDARQAADDIMATMSVLRRTLMDRDLL